MGEDTVEDIKSMFSVCFFDCIQLCCCIFIFVQELEAKISISLDAWTSSNQYAFLAIVAHYINNDGQLGRYRSDVVSGLIHIISLF